MTRKWLTSSQRQRHSSSRPSSSCCLWLSYRCSRYAEAVMWTCITLHPWQWVAAFERWARSTRLRMGSRLDLSKESQTRQLHTRAASRSQVCCTRPSEGAPRTSRRIGRQPIPRTFSSNFAVVRSPWESNWSTLVWFAAWQLVSGTNMTLRHLPTLLLNN